jgi:LPS-assembly lipoprotein
MKQFALLLLFLTLTACGFQPMYGKNRYESVGVESHLSLIQIGNIPNREGQYLRNLLIDRFYRNQRPPETLYSLRIDPIRESVIDLDITATSDSTRGQLRMESVMTLIDSRTNAVLLERKISGITSFNILPSEFTNRVSEQNARENVLNDLAGQIERQLNLYFKRDNATEQTPQ